MNLQNGGAKPSEPVKEVKKIQYFRKSDKIDEKQWEVLEHESGLKQHSKKDEHLPLCEQPLFESCVGVAILANAAFMALELDLKDPDASGSAKVMWMVADWTFCIGFSCEIMFRIFCLGLLPFVKQKKYLFDLFLVSLNVIDSSFQLAGGGATGLGAIGALRMLRIFKIVKMLRLVSVVEDLHLIVVGLVSALKSLRWVALLLAFVIFIMAVMLKIIVGNSCGDEDFRTSFVYHFGTAIDPTEKCQEFWGTVLKSMYSLYQVTTLESWSQVIARPIWDVKPHYVILILGFQLITTFGLLNIVVAAVVDGTMNSADEFVIERKAMGETISHLEVVRDIFDLTADSAGLVSGESLIPLLETAETRRKLLSMGISYDDPKQIYRILDADGNNSVPITELVRGFMRMRGTAKAKDLLAVRSLIYRCHHEIQSELKCHASELKQLSRIEANQHTFVTETSRQLQQIFCKLDRADQGGAVPPADFASDGRDRDMREQIEKVRLRIDNLCAQRTPSSLPSAPLLVDGPQHKCTTVSWNIDLNSELSKQFVQLQQEFQTLQRWLDAPPRGGSWPRASDESWGMPRGMPKGDRPLATSREEAAYEDPKRWLLAGPGPGTMQLQDQLIKSLELEEQKKTAPWSSQTNGQTNHDAG